MRTHRISIFILSFIAFSLLLFALPEKGAASDVEGCCILEASDSCAGCDGCAVLFEYCEEVNGISEIGGVCSEEGGGAACVDRVNEPGCCAIAPGVCRENLESRECFDTNLGIIWNPGSSCEEIPLCSESTSVPSLNQWGFIALAGILGIVGLIMVIRNKRATA